MHPLSDQTILVLQHVECEPPAVYEDILRSRHFELERIQLGNGEALPRGTDFAAAIVMGGPMSVNDAAAHPWLSDEIDYITEFVELGKPLWGVCLGAQLLAAALGEKVWAGAKPEVGMSRVQLTKAAELDEVFGGLPSQFEVFQWHGDTYGLPPGATNLVTSEWYENQAFRWNRAFGIQFHVEVTEELAAEWAAIPAYEAALEAIHGAGAAQEVLGDLARNVEGNSAIASTIFNAWLDSCVEPARHPTSTARTEHENHA